MDKIRLKLPIWPKINFWKLSLNWFSCIHCALWYCKIAKFHKILRAYHEAQACIGSNNKWAKIMQLAPKMIFWDILFIWFCVLCAESCCKVWKDPQHESWHWATILPKLPIFSRGLFFKIFTVVIFFYLLCPITLQSLKKLLKQILWYKLGIFCARIRQKLPI